MEEDNKDKLLHRRIADGCDSIASGLNTLPMATTWAATSSVSIRSPRNLCRLDLKLDANGMVALVAYAGCKACAMVIVNS